MEKKWADLIVLGTPLSRSQDRNSLSKDGSAGTPTVMSPLVPQIATGEQGRCLAGPVCVMHHALRLAPEYLWFLFVSPEEIRTKETSEAMFCLPVCKGWQHFRDSMGR